MPIISQRNRRVLPLVFAAALLLPSVAAAQPPEPRVRVGKSADITIDFVEAPPARLTALSLGIAAGPEHDARLLAALVKSGAADTKGIPLRCPDGVTLERGGPLAPAPGTTGRVPGEDFEGVTKALPRFNADGSVTVLLTVSLEPPFHSDAPIVSASAALTFRDGQTRELPRTHAPAAGGGQAHLIFVQASVVSGTRPLFPNSLTPFVPPGPLAAPRVFGPPAPPPPPSVDPGIVAGAPGEAGDPRMVIGRGTRPERLDPMVISP